MMRTVQAQDGRSWTVESRISWTKPERAAQFEHDMAAGYASCVAMLGVIGALTLFVLYWTPAGVVIPAWFVLFILLVLLFIPVSWAMQRPWVITAHPTEPMEAQSERWEGVVNGLLPAREEAHRVTDDLRERNTPGNETGPLCKLP